jgi:hypothetical protein
MKSNHREVLKVQRRIELLAVRFGTSVVKTAAARFVSLERARKRTMKRKQDLEKELNRIERSLSK